MTLLWDWVRTFMYLLTALALLLFIPHRHLRVKVFLVALAVYIGSLAGLLLARGGYIGSITRDHWTNWVNTPLLFVLLVLAWYNVWAGRHD